MIALFVLLDGRMYSGTLASTEWKFLLDQAGRVYVQQFHNDRLAVYHEVEAHKVTVFTGD